jgi:protein subunit release factor B
MTRLGIEEADLIEKFIQGTGPGGQKINKTASCVFLKHIPSGLHVKTQETRSREANRLLAREMLCDRFESEREATARSLRDSREKARRQNRKPSAAAKKRAVEAKRRRSRLKRSRDRPPEDSAGE